MYYVALRPLEALTRICFTRFRGFVQSVCTYTWIYRHDIQNQWTAHSHQRRQFNSITWIECDSRDYLLSAAIFSVVIFVIVVFFLEIFNWTCVSFKFSLIANASLSLCWFFVFWACQAFHLHSIYKVDSFMAMGRLNVLQIFRMKFVF